MSIASRALLLVSGLLAGCGAAGAPAAAPPAFELTAGPELVAPASSAYSEVRLAVSPDGRTALWGSKDRPGGPGGSDIWVATRGPDGWSAPAPVSFDTPSKDYDPAYSPDGRWVYFFSDRPGGLGGDDLYRAAVMPGGFGPAEHLGPEVNSARNEWAPLPVADGALIFASDGRGGRGRMDLFVAAARGDGFAPAEPLPGAINTAGDELDAALLAGGALVFARSANLDDAPVGLVIARRGPAGWDAGTPLPGLNAGDATYAPAIDFQDPTILYFSGTRPEASLGKRDIYRVRYRLR